MFFDLDVKIRYSRWLRIAMETVWDVFGGGVGWVGAMCVLPELPLFYVKNRLTVIGCVFAK